MKNLKSAYSKNFISSILLLCVFCLMYNIDTIKTPVAVESQNVKIASNKLIGAVPIAVALDKKLLEEKNINYTLNLFPTGSQVAQSMLASQDDFGGPISTIDLITIDSVEKDKIKLFSLLIENSTNPVSHILVKNDSKYQNITDLKGKKLGVAQGAFWQFLSKIMIKNHLNATDAVEYVIVPPGSWIPALETGKVDAVFSVEPYTTLALKDGKARSILAGAQSDVIKNIPVVGFAVESSFAQKNPEVTKKMISVIDEAIHIANSDRKEVNKALVEYLGLDNETTSKLKLNNYYNSSQLKDIKPELQEIADLLYEGGFIKKQVNVTNLLFVP